MIGGVIFEDNRLQIRVRVMGGMSVVLKTMGIKRKVSFDERTHFLNVCDALRARGIAVEFNSKGFERAAEQFGDAVISGANSAYWKVFFCRNPEEIADDCVEVSA